MKYNNNIKLKVNIQKHFVFEMASSIIKNILALAVNRKALAANNYIKRLSYLEVDRIYNIYDFSEYVKYTCVRYIGTCASPNITRYVRLTFAWLEDPSQTLTFEIEVDGDNCHLGFMHLIEA